ncbi:hypothetical protein [Thalassospira alkalitolerans]|uniref:hypothetical protein n=1 Tax=Thalassospira alkalitolerans TaxID=1293890 RepID=UPI003AA8DC1F
MEISSLDGHYRITLASNVFELNPGAYDFGTASVVLINGNFTGTDDGNIKWSGEVFLENPETPNDISIILLLDPANAPPDAYIVQPDGSFARTTTEHNLKMRLIRHNDDVRLIGTIEIGQVSIEASVSRVGNL